MKKLLLNILIIAGFITLSALNICYLIRLCTFSNKLPIGTSVSIMAETALAGFWMGCFGIIPIVFLNTYIIGFLSDFWKKVNK